MPTRDVRPTRDVKRPCQSSMLAAGLSLLMLGVLGSAARGQEPKAGEFYEDHTDLGFKVKMPAKWQTVPGSPEDLNLIVKYDPATNKTINLGKEQLDIHAWLVKFDRRKKAGEEDGKSTQPKFTSNFKDLPAWVEGGMRGGFKIESKKDVEINKVAGTEYVFATQAGAGEIVKLYAVLYKLSADVDVAVVFNGPGDPKKWMKWDHAFDEMAKSFKLVELKQPKAGAAPVGNTLRDKKRAELQAKIATLPNWKLYECDHYFIVSDNDDKDFIDELKGRLEAIHAIYEQDYPAAKAKELRAAGAAARTSGGDAGAKPQEPPDEDGPPEDALPPDVDPMEVARCSVVRVCSSKEGYVSYGGSSSSAGYWNSNARELVLFDDKAVAGRGTTWAVINHEAFHQYIYYFYGNIAPASWYNEGTGDFYSGYEYKNKRFTLKPFDWRTGVIKEAIREKKFIPLKEIVRYTQKQYYEASKVDVCYAEGWSFIYFLRTGKKNNAKGWDPKWEGILETYLRVLATSGKTDQAVEEAFQGVDWDALEQAWLLYTK